MPHVCGDEPGGAGTDPTGRIRMPHVCGDEPDLDSKYCTYVRVCPTYVGMNRNLLLSLRRLRRMPHVCGDEPCRLARSVCLLLYALRMWG